jgi:hypothetical protein
MSHAVRVAFGLHNCLGVPNWLISRLNTQPASAPVNASRTALRPAVHDSGSSWVATPSM